MRAMNPGGWRKCPGQEAVARVGLHDVVEMAQIVQMQRATLDRGDHEGRGPTDRGIRPVGPTHRCQPRQRCTGQIEGSHPFRRGHLLEIATQPRNAQAGQIAGGIGLQGTDRRLGRPLRAARVMGIGPLHGIVGQRQFTHRSRQRPDGVN